MVAKLQVNSMYYYLNIRLKSTFLYGESFKNIALNGFQKCGNVSRVKVKSD